MKVIVFLFLALLATSQASQTHLKALSKIYKDPTGAALLSFITLNLRAKTPLDEVRVILQGILNDHVSEDQSNEDSHAEATEYLNGQIDTFESNIQSTESLISNLQTVIADTQSSLSEAQQTLADNEAALNQEQQDYDAREAEAEVRIPELDQFIEDLQDAVEAASEAIDKMNTYKQINEGSSSFIQLGTSVKDRIKKFTDSIQGMKKKLTKHSNMFTPLMIELIDLTSTVSQSKADQVIDLLTQLLNRLNQVLSDTKREREEYEQTYEENQAAGEQKIQALTAAISAGNDQIAALTDALNQNQQNLDNQNDLLAVLQATLNEFQNQLAAENNRYQTTKAQVENLIDLINRVINYFDNNLTNLDQFVTETIEDSSDE